MFTLNHFLWLGLSAIFISLLLLLNGKKKLSFQWNLTFLTMVCAISEILKISVSMVDVPGFTGKYLCYEALPFHLCTIQIFFVFYLRFFCKSEQVKQTILRFMFPTMLAGGIMAMLIPTCGVEFNKLQVYQYFGFHMTIVFFALYILLFKIIHITFRTIGMNYLILVGITVIVLWANSFLQTYGANFLYLTRPPMEGLPFLNLNDGWYAYFIRLFVVAIVLLFIVQFPFALKNFSNKSDKILS